MEKSRTKWKPNDTFHDIIDGEFKGVLRVKDSLKEMKIKLGVIMKRTLDLVLFVLLLFISSCSKRQYLECVADNLSSRKNIEQLVKESTALMVGVDSLEKKMEQLQYENKLLDSEINQLAKTNDFKP